MTMNSPDSRNTKFKRGHPKRGGRKRGTPNRTRSDLKNAIVEVMDRIGENGAGKGGAPGFVLWMAQYHPKEYAGLLVRMLQINPRLEVPQSFSDDQLRSTDERSQEMRNGAPCSGQRDKATTTNQSSRSEPGAPWEWTGQPAPVGQLMDLAIRTPNKFCKILCDVMLPPPSKRRKPRPKPNFYIIWPDA